MKRSKKILFIVIPSLLIFFSLSFILTSKRQESTNIENISTDTSITKGVYDEMNKDMQTIKNNIDKNDSDTSTRKQDQLVCGNVTISLQGLHSAPGSAWLNKCLAYSEWDCKANVEGPEADTGTCEAKKDRAAYVTTEGIKSAGIALVKWECPVVSGKYCAKTIKYATKDASESYGENYTTCVNEYDYRGIPTEVCTTTCVYEGDVSTCGGANKSVTFEPNKCFDDENTNFLGAVQEQLNPENHISSSSISYTSCSPFVSEYNCDAVNKGCYVSAPGVQAKVENDQNCCGNVCQGCTRECKESGPSEEGIDGEQFTATYNGTTVPSYCVNQHLLMPQNGKFMWDSSFNVTACENSLSSKDCGYGYILLKAEVEKAKGETYNYNVINVALRLWAASDTLGRAAGYDNTPGVPVSMTRGFVAPHWNVYVQSAKKENLRRYIKTTNSKGVNLNGSYKNVTELSDLQEVQCSSLNPIVSTGKDMGVLCTGSSSGYSKDYLKSLYLYMLALQGNKMPTSEIFEEEDIRRPYIPSDSSIEYVSIDNDSYYTIIKFKMSREVEVECEAGDPECKTNIYVSTKPFDKNVTEAELKKNPDKYGIISQINNYEECKKNICYVKMIDTKKICSEDTEGETKTLYYRVITPKSKADMSVKKFVACDSPGSNQIFFSFDKTGTNANNIKYSTEDYTDSTIKVTCPCNPAKKCMNNDIVDRRQDVCETKTNADGSVNTEADAKNYDTYENYSIEDPSMNCIINMCYDGQQNQYDYSEKYGVNTKYCKLYCRDEVRFYLANKTKVYTGMQFRYDVGGKLKKDGIIKEQIDTNDYKYLTSVVREERHCTSIIDYDSWKQDFNKATNNDDREQLIYDLENCNLYDVDDINVTKYYEDAKLIVNADGSKSKYTTVGYIKKTLKCEGNGNDDSCASMELEYNSKYSFGINEYAKDEGQVVSEVKYCSGDNCYKYECPYATSNLTYKERVAKCDAWSKTEEAEFDPDGENQTTTISYKNLTIPTNQYAAIIISDEVDFSNPIKYKTKVYTGDIEKMEENEELKDGYTQIGKNSFPVELNQRTFVNDPLNRSNWKFVNHKYTFRLLVDRPNKSMHKYLGNINGYQYDYDYTCYFDVYNKSTDYSGDPESNYNKCYEITADGVVIFHKTFIDANGNEVACSNESLKTSGYGFIYRNVQLDNMFPSEGVRETGNNWTTDKAKEAIKEIEASADKIYTTDDYLEYSYTLTPEAIKNIKDYNKQEESFGGYQNSTLYGCESSKTNVSAFENCKSKFLDEIAKEESVLGMYITAHKSDGISTYTQNKNKTNVNVPG